MGLLEGKKVFVSGGSRGIGKAICLVCAREGADIVFNYNKAETEAQDTLNQIQKIGRKSVAYKVSVTDKNGIENMLRDANERLGGDFDILINNAAINKSDYFLRTTESSWNQIIDVNLNGLFYLTKPIYKRMVKQKKGAILNISSIAATSAVPTSVHYATTKAAVLGFTKCLAREAGNFGISVNAIAAGIYNTDLGHTLPKEFTSTYKNWCIKKRLGEANELAEFAAFLVSDRNSYMTGEVITIDGGTMV